MFNWLFGNARVMDFTPGRGWTVNVVGESNYQDALQGLYRSHGGTEHDVKTTATLVPEKDNKFDENAVRVEIKRRLVGYLTREMAVEYRHAVGAASGGCGAKIFGGYVMDDGERASYGVKLNVSWPPKFKSK